MSPYSDLNVTVPDVYARLRFTTFEVTPDGTETVFGIIRLDQGYTRLLTQLSYIQTVAAIGTAANGPQFGLDGYWKRLADGGREFVPAAPAVLGAAAVTAANTPRVWSTLSANGVLVAAVTPVLITLTFAVAPAATNLITGSLVFAKD
jgi:hypothetical protein